MRRRALAVSILLPLALAGGAAWCSRGRPLVARRLAEPDAAGPSQGQLEWVTSDCARLRNAGWGKSLRLDASSPGSWVPDRAVIAKLEAALSVHREMLALPDAGVGAYRQYRCRREAKSSKE